ncbi:nucleotide exchange factor GrpE [Sphingobacterium thermophilum]|uniref:Protein GrpE n=2 Tax=Sphingobacteriaceae TaxID=84566 RepID=A0ABP8R0H3_9SPHI
MAKLLKPLLELLKYLKKIVIMNEKENIQDEKQQNENVEQNEKEHTQEQETSAETPAPSQEEVLSNQLAEMQDKYARLFAEFDNYKKRTAKERIELIQTAGQAVISKLLPVLDDFDRALSAMATAQDIEAIKQGIELVNNKFRKILENEGLKEIKVIGEPFDADFQEAITAIPAPSEDMKNKVIDVVEKGYTLNDKVIRYAKVVIGQ